MKTIFGKEEIEMYSQKASQYCGKQYLIWVEI